MYDIVIFSSCEAYLLFFAPLDILLAINIIQKPAFIIAVVIALF